MANTTNRFSQWTKSVTTAAALGAVGSVAGALGIYANAKSLANSALINASNASQTSLGLFGIFIFGLASVWFTLALMGFGLRAAQFVRQQGGSTRWKPGWAIWSWFVPVLSLFVPFIILRDVVRATNAPDAKATERSLVWFWIWWVVLANLASGTLQSVQSTDITFSYAGLTMLAGVIAFHLVPFMMSRKLFKKIDADLRAYSSSSSQ